MAAAASQDRSTVDRRRPVQVVRADQHPPDHAGEIGADLVFLDPPYRFLTERPDELLQLALHLTHAHLSPDGDGRLPPRREERAGAAEPGALRPARVRRHGDRAAAVRRSHDAMTPTAPSSKPPQPARRRAGRRAPPARGGPRRVLRRRVRARRSCWGWSRRTTTSPPTPRRTACAQLFRSTQAVGAAFGVILVRQRQEPDRGRDVPHRRQVRRRPAARRRALHDGRGGREAAGLHDQRAVPRPGRRTR